MNNPKVDLTSFQAALEKRRAQAKQQRDADSMSSLSSVGPERVPDRIFARLGYTTRDKALTKCDVCGVIEPLAVEQGWIRRECACERDARYELRDILANRENARLASEEQAREAGVDRCYTWLGADYSEFGMDLLTFDVYNAYTAILRAAKDRAEMFSYEPIGTLIFHGPWGVGKSHLASAILNVLRAEGKTGLFTTGPNLYNAIQARRDEGKGYQDILTAMYKTPLLVIDDIDKAKATEYRVETYTEVLNKRVNREIGRAHV